jgi:hypothetical protein
MEPPSRFVGRTRPSFAPPMGPPRCRTSALRSTDWNVLPVQRDVSPSLREFADKYDLPKEDVEMLARIRFRGAQPSTESDWMYLYESIKRSISG